MFDTLHLDVIPIIFDYLSQKDLINIKYTNQLLYNQYDKYVMNTKFVYIDDLNKLYYACSNKYYISFRDSVEQDCRIEIDKDIFDTYTNSKKAYIKIKNETSTYNFNIECYNIHIIFI